MSELTCPEWQDISDRLMLEEPCSELERVDYETHGRSCSHCGREFSALAQLGPKLLITLPLPPPTPVPAAPELVTPAFTKTVQRCARPVVTVAVASAFAALSLAAMTSLRLRRSAPPLAPPTLTWLAGPAALAAGRPSPALTTQSSPACVGVDQDLRVCADRNSRILIKAATTARIIELAEGSVALSLGRQRPGYTVSVSTAAGTVTAIGTAFVVVTPRKNQPGMVRVDHGIVELKPRGGASRRQTVGQGSTFRNLSTILRHRRASV